MRKYQAIWEHIKKHGSCTIVTAQGTAIRTIRAVKKERTKDRVYRIQMEIEEKVMELKITQEGSKVSFKLVEWKDMAQRIGAV